MRKLSLFSGIGGIDLAAHWAGMETVAFCEREPFPQRVLRKHWPGVPIYDDVCKLTKEVLTNDGIIGPGRPIDMVSAGFPCQPVSVAGNREGTDDERYLWPEVVRILSELGPTWFVGENVTGLLSMAEPDGATRVESRISTSTEDEDFYEAVYTQQEIMLINHICQDLKDLGREVQVFVIPAAAIGASHKRDRVFIISFLGDAQRIGCSRESRGRAVQEPSDGYSGMESRLLGDAAGQRLPQRGQSGFTPAGTEAQSGRESTELKRSGETVVADPEGVTARGLPIGAGTEIAGPSCGGEALADPSGSGCKECNITAKSSGAGFGSWCRIAGGETLAHSKCGSLEESGESFGPRNPAPRRNGQASGHIHDGGRPAQPRVGRSLDELSSWLDRGINPLDDLAEYIANYPQPALLGQRQHDWEPPRVAVKVPDRVPRIKALGNAVNPLQIYPIMYAIMQIHMTKVRRTTKQWRQ